MSIVMHRYNCGLLAGPPEAVREVFAMISEGIKEHLANSPPTPEELAKWAELFPDTLYRRRVQGAARALSYTAAMLRRGYAPGGYLVKCNGCDQRVVADKRAYLCRSCAHAAVVRSWGI